MPIDPSIVQASEAAQRFLEMLPADETQGMAEVDAEVTRLIAAMSPQDRELTDLSLKALSADHQVRSPRAFLGLGDAYFSVVLENLCCPDRPFRRDVDEALNFGTGKVAIAMATALGFSGVPAGLIVPIAAALARFGVDAVCRYFADRYGPCEGSTS